MVIVNVIVIVIVSLGTAPWCVYIIAGVGRLDVAYPHIGAMREPEVRDKHERDILPRLFCFHSFLSEFGQFGERLASTFVCPYVCERFYFIYTNNFIHLIKL